MAHEQLGIPYHDSVELVPRLVLGAPLVNTSLAWDRLANDAFCLALDQASLPAWDRAVPATQLLANALATLI